MLSNDFDNPVDVPVIPSDGAFLLFIVFVLLGAGVVLDDISDEEDGDDEISFVLLTMFLSDGLLFLIFILNEWAES